MRRGFFFDTKLIAEESANIIRYGRVVRIMRVYSLTGKNNTILASIFAAKEYSGKRRSIMTEQKGFVHLYSGDGKGKTTAAAGLALRALGSGRRVLFSQFLKSRASGETEPLERLGAEILRAKTSEKFFFQMPEEEREAVKQSHTEALATIRGKINTGGFGLVVMDEVIDAVNCGAIALCGLLELIGSRPGHVEIVLTGRAPPPELVEICDYYTEFTCKAHPYQKGVAARAGIEY